MFPSFKVGAYRSLASSYALQTAASPYALIGVARE